MREIKLRGRGRNGAWVFRNLLDGRYIVGEVVEWDSEYFATSFWWTVDPETVGQYSGLKDRNGVDIYEGDIIRNEQGETAEVEWMIEHCAFMLYERGRASNIYHLMESDGQLKFCEVIGNIYEHPNLLAKESEEA